MEDWAKQGLTVFSMDMLPRISRTQSMDVLSSQANIAGYKSVILAASIYPHYFPMTITAAGSVAPAKVMVIGAGVAGLQAVATAKRLGAVVQVFDTLIGNLAGLFAMLAIFISCLGLFGLAAYTAERRTKEIGVRKVLGASVTALTGLLAKEFLQLVTVSCIIAFPVAWWLMNN